MKIWKFSQIIPKISHFGRKIMLKTAKNAIKLQFFAIFYKERWTLSDRLPVRFRAGTPNRSRFHKKTAFFHSFLLCYFLFIVLLILTRFFVRLWRKSVLHYFFRAVDIFADLCDDNHHERQIIEVIQYL